MRHVTLFATFDNEVSQLLIKEEHPDSSAVSLLVV